MQKIDERSCFSKATIRNFRIVQIEGSHKVKHYILQMIIAVRFKTNNAQTSLCNSS